MLVLGIGIARNADTGDRRLNVDGEGCLHCSHLHIRVRNSCDGVRLYGELYERHFEMMVIYCRIANDARKVSDRRFVRSKKLRDDDDECRLQASGHLIVMGNGLFD